ncbi:MAG: hypothetical protein PHC69_07400 [Ruminiclostridium sp.]|nr:hypothetical protein [Ruminiclostridium sp.]
MNELNTARENLYCMLESGIKEEIMEASRKLDKIILKQMIAINKKLLKKCS